MNSRIYISLLLGVLLCASSIYAQDTLVISERVGKVLDKEECRYFGLFPTVRNYNTAVFLRKGDSISIRSANTELFTISREMYMQLGEYITEYDNLIWSLRENQSLMALNQRLEPLQDALLIMPVMIWKGQDVKLEVKGPRKNEVLTRKGELIWAGEKQLILLPHGEYDYADCDTIPPGEILSVTLYEGNNAWTGAIVGGIMEGFLGFAAGQGMGGSSNTGYHDPEPFVVAAMAVLGATSLGGLGALFGAISPRYTKTDIEILYDYHSILPQLQARMYYRHGLPLEIR